MEQDDGLHIKQENVDHQNATFQIKEECNLQWDDSPGDVQINEENVNFKKHIFIGNDQNRLGEMDSGYKHVHRNEYKCDSCGKTFSQVDRLNTHIITHTNVIFVERYSLGQPVGKYIY